MGLTTATAIPVEAVTPAAAIRAVMAAAPTASDGMWGFSNRRVGLLGGSFNPAHGGHLDLSKLVLKHLDLDEIWWLVSPQNPLKSTTDMMPFSERLETATAVAAAERRIRVTGIERRFGSTYTADTLRLLRRRFPRIHFVWLMGGDNLVQLPHWKHWQEIFRTIPIAVFNRPNGRGALAGTAAHRFSHVRVPVTTARRLALMSPPAWVFFHTKLDYRSATRIREERDAFKKKTNPRKLPKRRIQKRR